MDNEHMQTIHAQLKEITRKQDEIISLLNESFMPSSTDQIREIARRLNQGDASALKEWNRKKKKELLKG